MTNNENGTALKLPSAIRVSLPNGQVEEMKLETYLAGAVAAEIGADAPLEALKAQAVASRTYVAAAQRHPEQNADVCTTAHCQKWKWIDPVTAPEVFRALSETWGMVAAFDAQLISAFFFEHCDGHTRNAEEMHIPALGYLRGVDCSCGFLTLKGHGVGMCKRGAIVMARRGASFEQILQHYYRGISIVHTASEAPVTAHVESAPEPTPAQVPAAPKPRPRRRKTATPPVPPVESVEPPKPKRRTTRRTTSREIEPPPTPQRVIEITAVPASVGLKRVQITPAETEPSAPSVEEKTTPLVIASAEPAAPISEIPPANLPARPRLELDLPVRPAAPPGDPASAISWRLVKPEPIDPSHEAPVPIATDETPSMIGRRVHIDHLPGDRMICGALPRAGLVVTIEDEHGNQISVNSGTAPHYGEGGFEMLVAEDGKYAVTIGGQLITVQVHSDTVFIHA